RPNGSGVRGRRGGPDRGRPPGEGGSPKWIRSLVEGRHRAASFWACRELLRERSGGGLRYESPSRISTCAPCRRRAMAALASSASAERGDSASTARLEVSRVEARS